MVNEWIWYRELLISPQERREIIAEHWLRYWTEKQAYLHIRTRDDVA